MNAADDARRRVARAGHLGDPATARAHLVDADGLVRASALRALARCDDLRTVELRDAAADPDPRVRVAAAEVAAAHGPRAATGTTGAATAPAPTTAPGVAEIEAVLLELLGDPDDRVCDVAAFALGELPLDASDPGADGAQALAEDQRRVIALSEVATGHADSLCRESAVAALGALGHPGGLPAVLSGCTDRAPVRRRAVLALAAFDDPRASAMIDRLTEDRDLQVSQAATDLRGIETGEDT